MDVWIPPDRVCLRYCLCGSAHHVERSAMMMIRSSVLSESIYQTDVLTVVCYCTVAQNVERGD